MPGDRAFLQGSVAYMSRSVRSAFICDLATTVMHGSKELLLELLEERLLSVDATWNLVQAVNLEGPASFGGDDGGGASASLNSDLGLLGNDGEACRRW